MEQTSVTDDALQSLIDRNEIIDTFSRYAIGIDQKDPVVYRACFTDELHTDMWGTGFEQTTADEWVAKAIGIVGAYQTTQHIITNHTVTIDGDQATAVAYLQAQHWNPDAFLLVGGHYTNEFVRTSEGWRINRLQLTITWNQTG
jgi:hypothetical protein